MSGRFEGRTVIVTGAASGIGREADVGESRQRNRDER